MVLQIFTYARQMTATLRHHTRDRLHGIACPTLLLRFSVGRFHRLKNRHTGFFIRRNNNEQRNF